MSVSRLCNLSLLCTFIVICFTCTPAISQEQKTSGFVFTVSAGGNYLFEKAGWKNTGSDFSLNTLVFEFGFKANEQNEFGIAIGKNTDTYFDFRGISGFINNDTIYTNYQAHKESAWLSAYYKFHFINLIYAGARIGHISGGDTYHELSVGKDFRISEKFKARANVFYGIIVNDLLNFSDKDSHHTVGASFGLVFDL